MRWWHRLLVTLILAPLLWRLGNCYIASQQGSSWADLARDSVAVMGFTYLAYTLPALLLCGVLLGADLILHRLGLDLMTVLISPVLAFSAAWAVLHFVHDPRVQAAEGLTSLAVFYGLTWGLSVRERRDDPEGQPTYVETTTA